MQAQIRRLVRARMYEPRNETQKRKGTDMKQPSDVLAPKPYRVLSGSALKLIAVISMFIDHASKRLLVRNPTITETLFSVGTHDISWFYILTSIIGRLAFPIFCFLLVEGFIYTRDRRRYGCNLLLFALISEVPFDISRMLTPFDPSYQNVFFTLFVGYLGMCAFERFKDNRAMQAFSVIGLALVSMALKCDYGERGYALIMICYLLRDNAVAKSALGCCVTSAAWRAGLAFIPINFYNGKRGFIKGPVLKFAFYAFYPVHLLFLWLSRMQLHV